MRIHRSPDTKELKIIDDWIQLQKIDDDDPKYQDLLKSFVEFFRICRSGPERYFEIIPEIIEKEPTELIPNGRDPKNLGSIIERQRNLRRQIRQVRLYCKVMPSRLPEWERVANLQAPGF